MNSKIEDYKKIKEYCASFNEYQIYDYLYFIGITNVIEDIPDEELLILMNKCEEFSGDYTDPIEVAQSLATKVYIDKEITIEQLKNLSIDNFYSWYNNGKELGNPLEMERDDR